MGFWSGFTVGLFVGANVGFVAMMLLAGSRGERK
jgi:gas vesicle protein